MAFWPEDDVNHLRFMYTTRYAERKPGLDKSQVWLTLHNFVLSIDLYVKSRVYKAFLDNRGGASHWKDWFPPCLLFLLYFLAEFPSGAWRLAMSTYLPWLLRSMREGAQGGALSAIQMNAGGLT